MILYLYRVFDNVSSTIVTLPNFSFRRLRSPIRVRLDQRTGIISRDVHLMITELDKNNDRRNWTFDRKKEKFFKKTKG